MTGGKLRIFVVEDHPGTARAVETFLRGAGFEVAVATDMTSALKLARNLSFDVLLCDLNLPDGTGWDLIAQLRKRGPVRGIAFSAFDDPDHIARSEAVGFMEHFVKGSPPQDLVTAINRVATAFPPSPPAPQRRVAEEDLSR